MAESRATYLTSVLNQLKDAIRRKDTGAADRILRDVMKRSPKDAEMILNRLIVAGMRSAANGRRS